MSRSPERVPFPQILISSQFHDHALLQRIDELIWRCSDSSAVRGHSARGNGVAQPVWARLSASQGALIKPAIARGPESVSFYQIIKLSRMHVLSRIQATGRRIRDGLPSLRNAGLAAVEVGQAPCQPGLCLPHTPLPTSHTPAPAAAAQGGRGLPPVAPTALPEGRPSASR